MTHQVDGLPAPRCWRCETTFGRYWWWCPKCEHWECDSCSYPDDAADRRYEDGTCRFFHDAQAVERIRPPGFDTTVTLTWR
jgi:hypothetical protein